MNLSEFLLARIAEAEAAARRVQAAYDDEDHFWAPGVVVNAGALVSPARVLAECEAKRQLVAEHGEEWRRPHRDLSPMNSYIAKGRLNGLWTALQILALPYADHPDYDATWRP